MKKKNEGVGLGKQTRKGMEGKGKERKRREKKGLKPRPPAYIHTFTERSEKCLEERMSERETEHKSPTLALVRL